MNPDQGQVLTNEHRAELLQMQAGTLPGALLRCASASMEPTIAVGEEVRVFAVPLSVLEAGDVVAFEGKGGYMLHRLLFFGPGRRWFLHVGDASTWAGPRRAMSNRILGKTSHPRRRSHLRNYLLGSARALWTEVAR